MNKYIENGKRIDAYHKRRMQQKLDNFMFYFVIAILVFLIAVQYSKGVRFF